MNSNLDRESLRARIRVWSDHEFRIALERVVEQLPDSDIERLLRGLVHLHEHRVEGGAPSHSLRERIEAHADATRRGEFRGELVLRNAPGQREPWQTAAWLAATSHTFDLALDRMRIDADAPSLAGLSALTMLVGEVDERPDELVVFESGGARESLAHELQQSSLCLAGTPPPGPGER